MTDMSFPPGTNNVIDSIAGPDSRRALACLAGATVAGALFAGAPLLSSGPAQAGPMFPLAPAACDNWRFKGAYFQLQLNDRTTTYEIPVAGETVGPGDAMEHRVGISEEASFGPVSGGIKGRDRIEFAINFSRGPWGGVTHTFTGHVDDEGRARGEVSVPPSGMNRWHGKVGWQSADSLSCITPEVNPAPPPPPPPPRPAPPEVKPLEGPAVSWDPVLGGLVVHITDRSGVDSQCTYKADDYERGFFLPANETYDLVIVPAIPKLGTWDVNVACDNGASTRTSIYF